MTNPSKRQGLIFDFHFKTGITERHILNGKWTNNRWFKTKLSSFISKPKYTRLETIPIALYFSTKKIKERFTHWKVAITMYSSWQGEAEKNSSLFLPLHIRDHRWFSYLSFAFFLCTLFPSNPFSSELLAYTSTVWHLEGPMGEKNYFIKYKNLLISASSLTGQFRALVFNSIITDSNYTVKQCILRVFGNTSWWIYREGTLLKKRVQSTQSSFNRVPLYFFFITWTPPYMHNRTLYLSQGYLNCTILYAIFPRPDMNWIIYRF